MTLTKAVQHLGVRFYRSDGVEIVLVPLVTEIATFTRSAGDGYFLVALMGEPGTAYPLDLRSPGAFDADYLAQKFRLDRRGFGYTPEELSAVLREVARDIGMEEGLDR